MTSKEIRQKFLKFFKSKGHKIIPSASLIPENDPSVLFTTAGMQQFKPYYIGKKNAKEDFGSLNVASVQKCVRTSDIDEVGNGSHLTFFEMLGNFSFGGYWKIDAIKYAYEFITSPDWMNLKIDYISVFAGEDKIPPDSESEKIWKSIDPNIVVKKSGRADNFWGPTGEEGPCGPTTEIYVDGIEIWNIVFNEFYQNSDKTLKPLETKGVDTGMGLERLVKVVQKVPTVFDTDLFALIISSIISIVGDKPIEKIRIVADHLKAIAFIISDGVEVSNVGHGYVLRRLIRRAMLIHHKFIGASLDVNFYKAPVETIINTYPELNEKKDKIFEAIGEETEKFEETLEKGLKEFNWVARTYENEKMNKQELPASIVFGLVTTYGFPFELIEEISKERGMTVDRQLFQNRMEEHKIKSRASSEQKFKGGLGGHSEMEIKYHTATHLLRQALEEVLGENMTQKGSNITPERLRFDFSFNRKMTDEEEQKVEDLVNQKISENLPVNKMVMNKEEAEKTGAAHVFGEKYGDEVSIYYIGDSLESAWSKEFCGGPHAENTGDLASIGGPEENPRDKKPKRVFKIIKEEASSAGVRRIKAILE
ncbi:MAG: hypothetical protein A3E02_00430 [Candidatus Zambryskibacteria bacterium RIFCSPHIGHO2_12_FULL_38_34]|uniref:alanine--tRNA ligase n=1 Tax=Candidatus Zambryskibacteria bacterium RIFCSPLOWO2_12_FULL_39_16 TaxID=1802775 RepID=A0A1G2USL8_9BACT|nr:MAG: hypothetical protein A3D37_00965 [Candidatus Zambryskibacteria bacterium RIFCSPHIGHO2_02_FULL_38_22]OHA98353.1 MAG: hypothetical protein A3E02_00430 [Candidatus Zambryskibacteria bacterium RIFCSPHIGHO2_12_FULL_38_34]OHB08367.1 MAG: hypothetical protein A3I19_01090 [Candidatus Zambryskibacteria bacterium RIFCSPLOWO2_02_FULL_38_13]OHB12366.1 MAG: hypothetical protein A3G46_00270 [Candidatus Zambryskibacteria bacterium RIFCSPLOWO2_12_FULL_39_16]